MASGKVGWFNTPGRPGDRDLKEQLLGLTSLLETCGSRTLLDVGCAEGLISIELAKRGAQVHGIDIVPGHIDIANRLRGPLPCMFEVADANTFVPAHQYDIILLLAVLHKLKDPSAAAMRFARAAYWRVVIRLPPEKAPVIIDARSGNKPHDIGAAMLRSGFKLLGVGKGAHDEWTGTYGRVV